VFLGESEGARGNIGEIAYQIGRRYVRFGGS